MTDPTAAHVEAVARIVCWMGGTEGHEPCMLHGDDSWTADTGYCEDGHDAAQQVLTCTEPAVLDALTDALVRAGRLREDRVETCHACYYSPTSPHKCRLVDAVRLVSEWREVR